MDPEAVSTAHAPPRGEGKEERGQATVMGKLGDEKQARGKESKNVWRSRNISQQGMLGEISRTSPWVLPRQIHGVPPIEQVRVWSVRGIRVCQRRATVQNSKAEAPEKVQGGRGHFPTWKN